MSWERGFKRAAYFFLAVVWALTIANVWRDGPAAVGETLPYLLLFTLGFMLLYAAVAWVVRGFFRDKKPPAAS